MAKGGIPVDDLSLSNTPLAVISPKSMLHSQANTSCFQTGLGKAAAFTANHHRKRKWGAMEVRHRTIGGGGSIPMDCSGTARNRSWCWLNILQCTAWNSLTFSA